MPPVGRVDELAALERLLTDLRDGPDANAVLVGGSGMGKTTLLRQVVARAEAAGATVLAGTCLEDAEVPYLPLATALAALPGGGGLEVGVVPAGGADDPDQAARYLDLLERLRSASQTSPVVLVVDDAQWLDPASIDLLSHLCSALLLTGRGDERHGVLVLIAHRPDPTGPARRLLDRLRRQPGTTTVSLAPLTPPEVRAVVEAVAGGAPTPTTVELLLEASGGNPLVLRGLLDRHLGDGRIRLQGRAVAVAPGATLPLLHGDLGLDAQDRVARLSERCRATLAVAAFIGTEGVTAVLAAALSEDVTGALAEAAAEGVVELDGDRYRFLLDEVRRHLRDVVATREPHQLHLAVADALEAVLGDDVPPTLLVHHLARCRPPDAVRLARWARLAGDWAYGMGAWQEAATAYDRAAEADPDGGDLAVLHLRAGLASLWCGDAPRCRRHLEAATVAAQATGDVGTLAEAAVARVRAAFVVSSRDAVEDVALTGFDELGELAPGARARVLASAADLAYSRLELDRAVALARSAVAEGRRAPKVEPLPLLSLGVALLATHDLTESGARLAEALAAATDQGDRHLEVTAASRQLLHALVAGDLAQVLDAGPPLIATMQREGYWYDVQVARCAELVARLVTGDLAGAERLAAGTELLGEWAPYAFTSGVLLPARAAACSLRGDHVGAQRAIRRWAQLGARGTWRLGQLVAVEAGEADAVRAQLAHRSWPAAPATADLFSTSVLVAQVLVGAAVGVPDMVAPALPALEGAVDRGVELAIGWPASPARALGVGLRIMEDPEAACRWLALAAERAAAIGASTELALAELDLGLAERDAGKPGAGRRLRGAAVDLDRLGLLPKAAAARLAAGAAPPVAARPRRRTLLCSDIVGSTAMNVRAGDEAYVRILGEHDRLVRERLQRHEGVAFKHTGDGVFAWFARSTDAVECALGIHEDLERWSAGRPEAPIVVRIGVAAGEPVDAGDDLFGLTVVAAARLCSHAGAGRVLVSEEVASEAQATGVTFVDASARRLRGLPGTIPTFTAIRTNPH